MAESTAMKAMNDSMDHLKSDISKIGMLVDRLDITIEKLTEVSASVTQLLTVHGSRLDFQDRIQNQLQETMERRRQENEVAFNKVHDKIETVQEEHHSDTEKLKDTISNKIDDIKKMLTTQHDKQNQRISKLETWMWVILGGSGVIAFLINKIDLTAIF